MWLSVPLVLWYLGKFGIPYVVLISCFHRLERWFKFLLYVDYVVSSCDMIYYLQETINNHSLSVGETGDDNFHVPFTAFSSFKALIAALEDNGLLPDVKEGIFWSLLILSGVCMIFIHRKLKEISRRSGNDEWHGRWEKIGHVLKEYSAPVVWEFTPEQIEDPERAAEYLKEKRCSGSREEQLTALCWALATLYRTLLDTRQSPQGEEGQNRPTAAPEQQPVPRAVTPEQNTSNTQSVCLQRDEEETESSEQEEETEPQVMDEPRHVLQKWFKLLEIRLRYANLLNREAELTSESRCKLQDIRFRFTRRPDRSLMLWLADCWLFGANTEVFLNRNEARQLGPLSWDSAIDWGISRRIGTLSLWTRIVSSMREAYTRDEVIEYRDRWNNKLEGSNYLTELMMVDILYGNSLNKKYLYNPDGAYCTWRMWETFKKSAPPYYAKALSLVWWHRYLTVTQLQDYILAYGREPFSLLQSSFFKVETQPKEDAAPSDDPCTICHDELGRYSCKLRCGHEFHRECIKTWLQGHSNPTCPICRVYAVLPKDVPERPAGNNSKRYQANAWKRSVF